MLRSTKKLIVFDGKSVNIDHAGEEEANQGALRATEVPADEGNTYGKENHEEVKASWLRRSIGRQWAIFGIRHLFSPRNAY
jgi:hypothetical protein